MDEDLADQRKNLWSLVASPWVTSTGLKEIQAVHGLSCL